MRLESRTPLPKVRTHSNTAASPFFDDYRPASEIFEYLQQLTASFPSLVTYNTTVGLTIEGRNIPALLITGTSTGPKKRIYLQGTIHAREWISPPTVVFIIENLVTLYQSDELVHKILDNLEVYVIPVLNLDGYLYSWGNSNQRLWRKNRRLNQGGSYGVDLNRNFEGVDWCEYGASQNPTAEDYCGTSPWSEETKVVNIFALSLQPLQGYIDYHSYGQNIYYPFGYTQDPPSNVQQLILVGNNYAAGIRQQTGFTYGVAPGYQLYATTGGGVDYFRGFLNVPLTLTVELRPTSSNPGFVLPPNQIVPTGEENWSGFKTFAEYIISN